MRVCGASVGSPVSCMDPFHVAWPRPTSTSRSKSTCTSCACTCCRRSITCLAEREDGIDLVRRSPRGGHHDQSPHVHDTACRYGRCRRCTQIIVESNRHAKDRLVHQRWSGAHAL